MSKGFGSVSEDFGGSILPPQYNQLLRHRSLILDGEHRLLWAVLQDAIRIYLANRRRSKRRVKDESFEEVRRWFEASPAEAPGLISFQSICDHLEIDPGRLRKRLKSLAAHKALPRFLRRGYSDRRLAA